MNRRLLLGMIRKLIVKNIQSHKKSVLRLAPGVNVIIGESDAGKSVLFRALDFVLNNVPTQISKWASSCSGRAVLDNCIVERRKTKATNTYLLTRKKKTQTFKAFRSSIPEEIEKAVNMSDLNWQYQHDPHFLLSSSAGEVARSLNDVVKLSAIHEALRGIESKKRQAKNSLQASRELAKELKKKLQSYAALDDLEKKLIDVEKLERQSRILSAKIRALSLLLSKLREQRKAIKRNTLDSKLQREFARLKKLHNKAKLFVERKERLETMVQLLDELRRKEMQHKINGIRYRKELPTKCPTCGRPL